jgi:outer membrane receptor protein involved in Fe transport
MTDSNGRYVIANLPIGTYTVTATKSGFSSARQASLDVTLGSQVAFNPKLEVGQVTETVEVTGSAQMIETTSSRTSTNITSDVFSDLPKGRNFGTILMMAPGVQGEVKGGNAGIGGIQVDGASGLENAYIVDGVDVTDVVAGQLRAANAVPLEFLSEVQVKSGGFEAEFGGATGGVVNVATKSGSNELHGEAIYLWTNNGLNVGDKPYWQLSPVNASLADFYRPKEDSYSLKYPGFTLGGPILKNRLFFMAGYMPILESTTRTVNYTAGPRTWNQTIKSHYSLSRVDFNPTQKLQINTSWIWSPVKRLGTLPNRDPRVTAPSNNLAIQGGFVPSQSYTASANYSVTPRFLVSARYGYKYYNAKPGNYGVATDPYIIYNTAAPAISAVPVALQQGTGWRNVSSTLAIEKDITTRHNVYVDGTYVLNIGRQQHTFKAGWMMNRAFEDYVDDFTNGEFTVDWGGTFSRGSINNAAGTYGFYTWEDGTRHNNRAQGTNQGMYFQDAWRVSSRFSLNLGVRLENEFLPPYSHEFNGKAVANPITFGWGDKVAPRAGFAWDLNGDGKWKLAGAFGIYYDVMKFNLAQSSFGGEYWWSHVYKLDSPAALLNLTKKNPSAAGSLIVEYDNRTLPVNAQGQWEGVDPAIKPYTEREFSFLLDHEIKPGLVFGVRYVRKDLLKAIEDIGDIAGEAEIYLIGNPGFGQTRNASSQYGGKAPNGVWYYPKAVREYNGLEFRLNGHLGKYYVNASYTYSSLWGNYAGLGNSDEGGRSNPANNRSFDDPYYYFDQSGSGKYAYGKLGTDRPNVFKIFASRDLKSKIGVTTFGLSQAAMSGTPDTTFVNYRTGPTTPYGRGNLGRTSPLIQTDLRLAHGFNLSERAQVKFEAEIRNLFNQNAVLARVTQMTRSNSAAITTAMVSEAQFFKGYNVLDWVGKTTEKNPLGAAKIEMAATYGLPAAVNRYRGGGAYDTSLSSSFYAANPNFGAYQEGRGVRLGFRLTF